MTLTPGSMLQLTGNVTTLNWIGARTGQNIEPLLGYAPGRLAQGYALALLKQPLQPDDFEFDGTTLRSGGREGLPLATLTADQHRRRIHDRMMDEYGADEYRRLQRHALSSAQLSGDMRIAKVLPTLRLPDEYSPSAQFPIGGGGLQWKILPPGKQFLVAMVVDARGMASTPGFTVDLGPSAPYENRARVMDYLRRA